MTALHTIVAHDVALQVLAGATLQVFARRGGHIGVDRSTADGTIVFRAGGDANASVMRVFDAERFAVTTIDLHGAASFDIPSADGAVGFFASAAVNEMVVRVRDTAECRLPSALAARLSIVLMGTRATFAPVRWEDDCAYDAVSLARSVAGCATGLYARRSLQLPHPEHGRAVRLQAIIAVSATMDGELCAGRAWVVNRGDPRSRARLASATDAAAAPPSATRPRVAAAAAAIASDISAAPPPSDLETTTPDERLRDVLVERRASLTRLAAIKGFLRVRDCNVCRWLIETRPVLVARSRRPVHEVIDALSPWPRTTRSDVAAPLEQIVSDSDTTNACTVCMDRRAVFRVCNSCVESICCERCLDTIVLTTLSVRCPLCRAPLREPALAH